MAKSKSKVNEGINEGNMVVASNGAIPGWISEIDRMHGDAIAHCFLVHGNIHDYVSAGNRLSAHMSLSHKTSEFVEFSIAGGLRFRTADAKRRVLGLIGWKPKKAAMAGMFADIGMDDPVEEIDESPSLAVPTSEAIDLIYQIATAVASEEVVTGQDGKPYKRITPLAPIILLNGADMLLPPGDKATMQPADRMILARIRDWGQDDLMAERGPKIILTTKSVSDVHSDIVSADSKIESVQIPMPDVDERQSFIERVCVSQGVEFTDVLPSRRFAILSTGLTLVHIEDIVLYAKSAGALDLSMIMERKRSIMDAEFSGLMEMEEEPPNFSEVGGHEHAKQAFMESVIQPLLDGEPQSASRAVALVGPSGTGKTLIAKAAAGEAKLPFFEIKIGGNIADKYQGEGEKRLKRALDGALANAPCFLFFDEADQVFARGTGNNQQESRIFQMLLSFIGDPKIRGKVTIIIATNRPDIIDAAFMRRMDDVIPVLPPEPEERPAIISITSRRFLPSPIAIGDVTKEMVVTTEGWTGAEIENASRKARKLMRVDKELSPAEAFLLATTKIIPTTREIRSMTDLAIAACNDTDLLPPRYRKVKSAVVEEDDVPVVQTRQRSRRA